MLTLLYVYFTEKNNEKLAKKLLYIRGNKKYEENREEKGVLRQESRDETWRVFFTCDSPLQLLMT